MCFAIISHHTLVKVSLKWGFIVIFTNPSLNLRIILCMDVVYTYKGAFHIARYHRRLFQDPWTKVGISNGESIIDEEAVCYRGIMTGPYWCEEPGREPEYPYSLSEHFVYWLLSGCLEHFNITKSASKQPCRPSLSVKTMVGLLLSAEWNENSSKAKARPIVTMITH